MGYDKKTGYFTLRNVLGYGKKYNLVLSPERGIGKTYGYKHWIMESPDIFMCVYRTCPDMEHAKATWTDDLTIKGPKADRYDPELFVWKGDKKAGYILHYDGQPKVYFRSISEVNAIKHETFPDEMAWVIWDEFIPLKWTKIAGIENEGEAFEVICSTIDHDGINDRKSKGFKPLRAVLFCNPFTFDNPVLSYFGVNGLLGYGIWKSKKPNVIWEYLEPGHMRDRGDVSDINSRNAAKEQAAFVEVRPKESIPFMSVRLMDKCFVFWKYKKMVGLYWVTESKLHANVRKIYGTLEGLREDEICLESQTIMLKGLQSYAQRGLLRYEDLNCKFDYLNRVMEV